MATEPICELTELPEDSCYHCRRRAANERKAANTSYFDAQYAGECETCGTPIEVGQRIKEREDGTYEHAGHR